MGDDLLVQVLFVCLGNICRSPMAEAIFRKMVHTENLQNEIRIDSAGTGSWHIGSVPHEGTRNVLDQKEISYEGQQARQVKKEDWNTFDYIIAMDEQNIEDLQKIGQKNRNTIVAKLMDFIDNPKETNVPDPYFTGDFDYTYELVSEGCKNLLHHIKNEHHID